MLIENNYSTATVSQEQHSHEHSIASTSYKQVDAVSPSKNASPLSCLHLSYEISIIDQFSGPLRGIKRTTFYGSKTIDSSSGLESSSEDDFIEKSDLVIPPTPSNSETDSEDLDSSGK